MSWGETRGPAESRHPFPRVAGSCPMGCGGTLILGVGGRITCSHLDCPWPTAVDDILDEPEHEHLVTFADNEFTVKHPLRERVGDELLTCDLHVHCARLSGPPVRPGIYRAKNLGGGWSFTKIESPHPPTEDGHAADPESAPVAPDHGAGDVPGSAATVPTTSTR